MTKEERALRKKLDLAKKLFAKHREAYGDLETKYRVALDGLQTLACNSVSASSPVTFSHDQRMAWTASTKLEKLAVMQQRAQPSYYEEP